jgi:hypothetical protein
MEWMIGGKYLHENGKYISIGKKGDDLFKKLFYYQHHFEKELVLI